MPHLAHLPPHRQTDETKLVSWGKIISPRVGLMIKDWVFSQPVLADFSSFSCGALGLWARATTLYFPPASLLTMPLPRNVLYDVTVATVAASGAASAPVAVQASWERRAGQNELRRHPV